MADSGSQEQADTAHYRVTVIDADGEPCDRDVYVKILQNGQQMLMRCVDGLGSVNQKLERGEYTVELHFSDSGADYYYDRQALTLTATRTELTIHLYHQVSGEPFAMYAAVGDGQIREYMTYQVHTGMTKVSLTAGQRNFFVFTPPESGYYAFSFAGEDTEINYYGMPEAVRKEGGAELEEGKFYMNVPPGSIARDGSTRFVIGVDAGDLATGGILHITRLGDFIMTDDLKPYTTYQRTSVLMPWALGSDQKLKDFDMNGEYTLVYNSYDGYYHLNTADGPLVLVRLGEESDADCRYGMDSVETVASLEYFCRWYRDEKGNLLEKVEFASCIQEYLKVVDRSSGLYPLTEDLKHIIIERGQFKGWWDYDSPNYIFYDEEGKKFRVNEEIAWLFNCCYIA